MATISDTERMAQATYRRPRWYGPVEHQECSQHPGRQESYRWVWKGERTDIEHAHTELVQDCDACARECDIDGTPGVQP